MVAKHVILGGKVHIYKRERSSHWQCAASVSGVSYRVTTKEESLERAKDFAEDWYLTLRGKIRSGEIVRKSDGNESGKPASSGRAAKKKEKTFAEAAEVFMAEFEAITEGQRSAYYVKWKNHKIRGYLVSFFGQLGLSEITSGKIQEYRLHRIATSKTGKAPARSTIHQEIVSIRQILKTALRHGWLSHLPDLSSPYKTAGKISHRAWFSAEDYKRLYEATRERAANPKKKRWQGACAQMHDYVLFMANTGLRPDEASRLEYRDVQIVKDVATGDTILEIDVRGKRGVGYCKSTPGAVLPFQRLKARNQGEPTDRLFPGKQRELFNTILGELGLKFDREGNRRTAYSLRHTYICLRLIEGADIYAIAKNCRTSVEMIEKFYASHIKDMLDTTRINVRRAQPAKRRSRPAAGKDEGATT
jgi:integrase